MSKTNLLTQLIFVTLLSLMTGCATYEYKPTVYPLAKDRIAAFDVKGTIKFENTQTSSALLESNSHSYSYKDVTDGFNKQFNFEISSRGNELSTAGEKVLKTSVDHFICETRGLNTWVYRCEIRGSIIDGDGKKHSFDYKHGAPVTMGPLPAFNGMIAIAVERSLETIEILNYLSK